MLTRGHNYLGLWINFEAGEGAGKTTQQKLLKNYLINKEFRVDSGREPGTTESGEQIRKMLQDPDLPKLNPKTEMLLYVAAGIEFFENMIKPVLEQGGIFITDRWRYSTKAYQGYGLGIDLNIIDKLTEFSCSKSFPDITFLIDIDPKLGLSKIKGNEFAEKYDKIESRAFDYHNRVNQGYRNIAKENPNRFIIIPYINNNPNKMQEQIRKHVDVYIEKNNLENKLIKKLKI